jgi:AraC-like DNA-binding protein
MLVALPHDHRYWLERGQRWEYFWMVVNGREAMRLAQEVLAHAGPVLRPSPDGVDRLAAACHALIARPDLQPGEASAAAYGAIATLHDAAFAGVAATRRELPPPIARAVAHVEENLARPLNVDRMAAAAGLSRAHFVRSFARALGAPPSRYLLDRRLDRVERLLTATDMPVGAIAASTGFANANYLAKTFRRVHGLAPGTYRQRMRDAAGN